VEISLCGGVNPQRANSLCAVRVLLPTAAGRAAALVKLPEPHVKLEGAVTRAGLSARSVCPAQSRFGSVFAAVAQVSGNVTHCHWLVFRCDFFFS